MDHYGIANSLKDIWHLIGPKEGWDFKESAEMLLLKSPAILPNLNLCILKKHPSDISNTISAYFPQTPYGIIYTQNQLGEYATHAKIIVEITEMQLSVTAAPQSLIDHDVRVVRSFDQLIEWCDVTEQIFGVNADELFKFIKEVFPLKNSRLFYYEQNEQMVGVGQIFVDDHQRIYLSNIGTLEKFQKKGIGTKIMGACLQYGKELGGKTYTLNATPAGAFLYKKLNFKAVNKWNFALFDCPSIF